MYEYLNSVIKMAKHFKFIEGFLVQLKPKRTNHTKQFPGMVWEIAGTRTIGVMQVGGWCGCFGGSERLIAWLSPILSWPEGKIWQ